MQYYYFISFSLNTIIIKTLDKKYNLITVLGPTAGGKTSYATKLALQIDGEIISADSRQVYKGMDIGTGKDIDDYYIEDKKILHHLIDIKEAGEKYNVFLFQKDFFKCFENINKKKKTPIMCGGTGMYLEAIIKNYNLVEVPENKELRLKLQNKSLDELEKILISLKTVHNKTEFDTAKRAIRAIEIETYHKNNAKKIEEYPKINSYVIGIKHDRELQRKRITERLKQRLRQGMIAEVEGLIKNGVSTETLIYYGLEYKFITLYLLNKMTYKEMVEKLNIAIHQFAKRQMTWFRRMEKKGTKINWVNI